MTTHKWTPSEERLLDEERLKSLRIKLQREIADQLREQQRVYDEVLKPNSADARLMTAAVRGQHGERALSPGIAKAIETMTTPTARFEWARAEVARISKLVSTKRTALTKAERELEAVRSNIQRLNHPTVMGWTERFQELFAEVVG